MTEKEILHVKLLNPTEEEGYDEDKYLQEEE